MSKLQKLSTMATAALLRLHNTMAAERGLPPLRKGATRMRIAAAICTLNTIAPPVRCL
jgi:hypothetical protein